MLLDHEFTARPGRICLAPAYATAAPPAPAKRQSLHRRGPIRLIGRAGIRATGRSAQEKARCGRRAVTGAQQNCALAQQMKRRAACRPAIRSGTAAKSARLFQTPPDMSKPRCRATVKMSLSPRPHMFMQMM